MSDTRAAEASSKKRVSTPEGDDSDLVDFLPPVPSANELAGIIGRNPLATVLAALGLGLILGKLLSDSRSGDRRN